MNTFYDENEEKLHFFVKKNEQSNNYLLSTNCKIKYKMLYNVWIMKRNGIEPEQVSKWQSGGACYDNSNT